MSKKPKIEFKVGQTLYFLNSAQRQDRYAIIPISSRLNLRKGKVEKIYDGLPWLDCPCGRYTHTPLPKYTYLTKKEAQPELKKRIAAEKLWLKEQHAELKAVLAQNKLI